MITQSLKKYAEAKGMGLPGFAPRRAKFELVYRAPITNVDFADSDFTILPLQVGDSSNKKQEFEEREFEICPETPQMNSGGKSHILLETVEVVLGICKEEFLEGEGEQSEDQKKKNEKKFLANQAKHDFFVQALELMKEVLPEAGIFAEKLKQRDFCLEMYRLITKEYKAKPTDKITLSVMDSEGNTSFLLDDSRWRLWWITYRDELLSGKKTNENEEAESTSPAKKRTKKSSLQDDRLVSLVTGKLVVPALKHPQITELSDVGASSMGASFICFDKDSLQSYGLKDSTNAAMDEETAAEYRAALNDICKNSSRRFGQVKICYWFDRNIDRECNPVDMVDGSSVTDDELDNMETDAHNQAGKLLESWENGEKSEIMNARYNALILSGNAGRVMVRDWSINSLENVVRAINVWFTQLTIVRRDGSGDIYHHKFMAIVGSLFRELTKDVLKDYSSLIVSLWKAALDPLLPIPERAVELALERIRKESYGDRNGDAIPPNHARMGLLRAYILRNHKGQNLMEKLNKDPDVAYQADPESAVLRDNKTKLNKDHPDVAYQCGRLLSCLADLQYQALGDVNAGLVQRFYSSVSITPRLVLGRLVRMAQYYVAKLDDKAAKGSEAEIAGIWSKIQSEIPVFFDLRQQTLFAQGYYQQKAATIQRIRDAKAKKNLEEADNNR